MTVYQPPPTDPPQRRAGTIRHDLGTAACSTEARGRFAHAEPPCHRYAPGGRTARAGGGRSSRPGSWASSAVDARELDVDVLARLQLDHRAPVDVDLDRLLARAVVDRQQVVGRDDERARGQRVRRDERDDEARHAPRQHRPAVGEVVARRALRRRRRRARRSARGRSPRPRARSARSATRKPGLRCTEMSFIAVHVPVRAPDRDRRAARACSNSPANARSKSASSPSGSSVARKPTSPKLTANTGTPVPAYSRSAVRIVPSPPITTQRSTSRDERRVDVDARRRALEAVLARLLGVEAQRHARACARRRSARASALAVSPARRWVSTVATRLTARPRAPPPRGRARAPRGRPRPASANVSRLPAGPGSPEEAKPSTAAPCSRAAAPTAHAAPRAAAPGRARRRPCRPARGPTSNCGLTMHQRVERAARSTRAPRAGPSRAR